MKCKTCETETNLLLILEGLKICDDCRIEFGFNYPDIYAKGNAIIIPPFQGVKIESCEYDTWYYICVLHIVTIPKKLKLGGDWRRKDLFILLHEFGHAHNLHGLYKRVPTEGAEKKAIERKAWEYAKDCIKKEYHYELCEFIYNSMKKI